MDFRDLIMVFPAAVTLFSLGPVQVKPEPEVWGGACPGAIALICRVC